MAELNLYQRRFGSSAEVEVLRGKAQELLGDRDAAEQAYRKALRFDSGHEDAQNALRELE